MLTKLFITSLLLPLIVISSLTQPLATEWTQTYSLPFSHEFGRAVLQSDDGFLITAGFSKSFGDENYDFAMTKLDDRGNRIWSHTYNYDLVDICRSVVQTPDGGFILCGSTETNEVYSSELVLLKTDSLGTQEWVRSIGGNEGDWGNHIENTSDGGWIASGGTWSWGQGMADYYLVKFDSLGGQQWFRTFGLSANDVGTSCGQTSDGGYFIAGFSDFSGVGLEWYRCYLVKTNNQGNLLWETNFSGEGYSQCYSARQTSDGGFVLAGLTGPQQFDPYDVYVVKTDSQGNTEWEHTYGGEGEDIAYSISQTSDGGYIITGSSFSFGIGEIDVYVLKIDSCGVLEWEKIYGYYLGNRGYDIVQTNDGGYFLCGETYLLSPNYTDLYAVSISSEPQPDITLSMTPENPPIIVPPHGGYVDFEIELSNSGFEPCQVEVWLALDMPFGITGEPYDYYYTIDINPGQTIVRQVSQYIRANFNPGECILYAIAGNHPDDPWVMDSFQFTKAENLNCALSTDSVETAENRVEYAIGPNPFNNSTTISFYLPVAGETSLKVYDISGREIQSLVDNQLSMGKHEIVWDAEGIASGVYFARLEYGGRTNVVKVILMK